MNITNNESICVANENVNKKKLLEQIKEELNDDQDKLANYLYKDKNGEVKTGTMTVD